MISPTPPAPPQLKKKELTLFDDSERNVFLVRALGYPLPSFGPPSLAPSRVFSFAPLSLAPARPCSQAKKNGYNAIAVDEAKAPEEGSDEKPKGGFNRESWNR